jgi:hypothetical protein
VVIPVTKATRSWLIVPELFTIFTDAELAWEVSIAIEIATNTIPSVIIITGSMKEGFRFLDIRPQQKIGAGDPF